MNEEKELSKIVLIMIILGLSYFVFGLFICIKADRMQDLFNYTLALVPASLGFLELFNYFKRMNPINGALSMDFVLGFMLVILSLMICYFKVYFYARMPLVVGWLIFLGMTIKLQKAVDLRRADSNIYIVVLGMSVISLILACLLLGHPPFLMRRSPFIFGVFLCVDGALTIATCVLFRRRYVRIIRGELVISRSRRARSASSAEAQEDLSGLAQSVRLSETRPEDEEPIRVDDSIMDVMKNSLLKLIKRQRRPRK